MTASQLIFLANAQLASSRLVLTHLGDLSNRAENSNALFSDSTKRYRCIRLATGPCTTKVSLSENALCPYVTPRLGPNG